MPEVTQTYELTPENIENNKFKVCLESHMGRCDAPCVSNINKFIYREVITELKQVVSFNFDQLRGKLIRKMNAFSKNMEFEKANTIKFRLNALDKYEKCVESARIGGYLVIADEFKTTFGLQNTPIDIEMYDNSHTAGDCQVSALVRYTNGRKNTSEYRKFNIKTVEGPDDYASFDEVLRRRFTRLLKERGKLPDMVIIDGGKGQLSSALKSIDELGLRRKITVIGIAKRLEELFYPGDSVPLYLDKKSETLKVIQQLRNEAHRFGITFHRNKRSKAALNSSMDDIPGIGEKTMQTLISHFKSVKRLKLATEKEILEVVGVSKAKKITDFYLKNK
jgi:excinuclease UvrABC nuclease subunit